MNGGESTSGESRSASTGRSRPRVLRASEIGEYVFCHRAWWLGHVRGVENANRARMEAGVARHRAHGSLVRRADWLARAALALLLVAALLALLLLAVWTGVLR